MGVWEARPSAGEPAAWQSQKTYGREGCSGRKKEHQEEWTGAVILREEACFSPWPGVQKEICKYLLKEKNKFFFFWLSKKKNKHLLKELWETAIWRSHRPKTSWPHSEEQCVETTRGTLKVETERLKRKGKLAPVRSPRREQRPGGRREALRGPWDGHATRPGGAVPVNQGTARARSGSVAGARKDTEQVLYL